MPTILKHLQELTAFQLPNQTNRLALVFDPLARPPVSGAWQPCLIGWTTVARTPRVCAHHTHHAFSATWRVLTALYTVYRPQVPFVFGVEIFEKGHRTQPHVHKLPTSSSSSCLARERLSATATASRLLQGT